MSSLKEHLKKRHLNTSLYKGVHIDEAERIATFYLYNLSGSIVGYQQYRPEGEKCIGKNRNSKEQKYFTHITKDATTRLAAWGLESLDFRSDILFVCEGVFDACVLHNFKQPAIALLTSDFKHIKGWGNSLGRELIGVPDNDEASKDLRVLGKRCFNVGYPCHDIAQMNDHAILLELNRIGI